MRNVHKFGGSSLASVDCYRRVAELVRSHGGRQDLVVVSAAGNTTDLLLALTPASLSALADYQHQLLQAVAEPAQRLALAELLDQDLLAIAAALKSGEWDPDWLLAFGEIWSARLLGALLGCDWLDARRWLRIDLLPDITESRRLLLECLGQALTVVTGFIGVDGAGATRTLGRNGSDYSAALLAQCLQATSVTLWTDVAGIYTADPGQLEGAYAIANLAGTVATELARLGSPVLHPRTLSALELSRQHLHIRSSFAPFEAGTRIGTGHGGRCPGSLTWRTDILCGHWQQPDADERAAIQASALAVQEDQAGLRAYFTELPQELIPDQLERVTLLGLVGQQLDWDCPAGRRLQTLAKDHEPLGFHQGRAGSALYCFVRQAPALEELAELHDRLFAVGVVVLGLGNIGSSWLDGFAGQLGDRLRLFGLVNSRRACFLREGIEPGRWRQTLASRGQARTDGDLLAAFKEAPFAHLLVLDLTASAAVAACYPQWLAAGVHLISANKQAGSAPLEQFDQLQVTLRQSGRRWFYNTTVGAGLPVQSAIRDLAGCGDQVLGVAGIFSGTLCWLFQQYDGSRPFSTLVRQAHGEGITEPDPRDDLNGLDAARKLLILARESGLRLELADVTVESLVPEPLAGLDREAFFERLDELDGPVSRALAEAREQGRVLRYVARLEQGPDGLRARVGLEALEPAHAFAELTPGDNIFAIRSRYYDANPLIIRGPGAGREVTAAGVQSDVLQCLAALA
ncbi:bifunctional aspartate kinase/homoserine dehydrogenase II [Gallaecimonas sp. GXIMD4217]|uniref:bifunctional aspartate kinase/homoserine dehydrogenase II n=1 Tax=Gallaecimonas sp. GXIMD4217 TaxID=3131927 RepID=UPI00311AED7B